jgi:hypothetical protein
MHFDIGYSVVSLGVETGDSRLGYNPLMSSFGSPTPATEERDSSRLIIVVAVIVVFGAALAAALLLRQPPKPVKTASPYIAKLKLSDFQMSAAENFIGHTVKYIDGSISNTGDKTVTRVLVEVNFEDSMGQVAQREEDIPIQIIRTNGAYEEPVDLSVTPLAPGQTAPYRLTFDSISAQWNHQYPDLTITDVTVK